jgi:hypothetical protein
MRFSERVGNDRVLYPHSKRCRSRPKEQKAATKSNRALGVARRADDGDDDGTHPDHDPHDADGPVRRLLGDDPPGARHGDRQVEERDREVAEVAATNDEHHDEQRSATERRERQHPRPPARLALASRRVCSVPSSGVNESPGGYAGFRSPVRSTGST